MKKLFFFIVLASLFVALVFQSNAWETRKVTATKDGMEYVTYKHTFHWKRLFYYLRHIPESIMKSGAVRSLRSG